MGLFDVLYQATLGRKRDKADRRHAERREDYLRGSDRAYFLADRDEQRSYDSHALKRLTTGAKEAGLHPLAALGAQVAGPATAFQSQSYSGGQNIDNRLPPLDFGAEAVNVAQAKLLNKQSELIDMQIKDSKDARVRSSATPESVIEALGDPAEITPQTFTPVIEREKTDPSVADANSKTNRYGESEAYETLLWLRTWLADWMYRKTGESEADRKENYDRRFRRFIDRPRFFNR